MSTQFNIQADVLKGIIGNLINPQALKLYNNKEHIIDILFRNLKDASIESVAHLMLTDKEFTPTKIGDYVKLEVPSYHKGNEFEIDVLEDMGLLQRTNTGYYVYGQVTGDGSWSETEPYDPFYSSIKVNLLYHDQDKKLRFYEHSVSPLHATRVTKGTIKYFKQAKQTKLKLEDDG